VEEFHARKLAKPPDYASREIACYVGLMLIFRVFPAFRG
jgi:hypothetical protein